MPVRRNWSKNFLAGNDGGHSGQDRDALEADRLEVSSQISSLTKKSDERRRIDYTLGRCDRPRTLRCRRCNAMIKVNPHGRIPEFCSQTCRQRAYEKRKWARPAAIEIVARDLATTKLRAAIRAETLSVMRQMGFVSAPEPPPPPKKKPKPMLRLVTNEPGAED
jgi:hypothetical protein